MSARFAPALKVLTQVVEDSYGDRLVSLGVYGSVARGTANATSDIDLMIVADPLPRGRLPRMDEFRAVEDAVATALAGAGRDPVDLSPIIKAPAEVEEGSLLFLDMTVDFLFLFDRSGYFAGYLDRLRQKLAGLGARRVASGGSWYWDLKPDFRQGDVIEL